MIVYARRASEITAVPGAVVCPYGMHGHTGSPIEIEAEMILCEEWAKRFVMKIMDQEYT